MHELGHAFDFSKILKENLGNPAIKAGQSNAVDFIKDYKQQLSLASPKDLEDESYIRHLRENMVDQFKEKNLRLHNAVEK